MTGYSSATFTSSSVASTGTVTAAADWTPPTVAIQSPGSFGHRHGHGERHRDRRRVRHQGRDDPVPGRGGSGLDDDLHRRLGAVLVLVEHHGRGRRGVRPARHRHRHSRVHHHLDHGPHHGRQQADRRAHRSGRRRQGQRRPDVVRLQRRPRPLPHPRRVRGVRHHRAGRRRAPYALLSNTCTWATHRCRQRLLRPAGRRHRHRHDLLLGGRGRRPGRQHGARLSR